MLMKILKAVGKVVVITLKVVLFPITYTWKKATQRRPRYVNKNDFPGVYIVSNSDETLKIGRSKHVLRRLKSYRGY